MTASATLTRAAISPRALHAGLDRLDTARLRLERPAPEHLPGFVDFLGSARADALGWKRPPEEATAFWNLHLAHWAERGFGWFVLIDRDAARPLGMCGPWAPAHLPEGELAWSLWDAGDEGRGLAFEAASAARAHAFGALGWRTAVSYVAPDNHRSASLATRLDARRDGVWRTAKGKTVHVYRHAAPEATR